MGFLLINNEAQTANPNDGLLSTLLLYQKKKQISFSAGCAYAFCNQSIKLTCAIPSWSPMKSSSVIKIFG